MAENTLQRLHRLRTEAIKAEVESLKAEHDRAMAVYDLQDLIAESLDYPQAVRRLCGSAWDRVFAHQLDDFQEAGETVLRQVDVDLAILRMLADLAQEHEQAGYQVDGLAQLHDAIRELQRLRQEFSDRWPWFNQKDVEEARADFARGEGVELDEAFARIAGVDRETWLRRVEQSRPPRDG